MTSGHSGLSPADIKKLVVESLDSDKAEDIKVIELKSSMGIADYMVIATGTSSRQVTALAEKLKDRLNVRNVKNIGIEGISQGDWVILDAGDVIVHLFKPEVREFYNIEKMWADPQKNLEVIGSPVTA